MMTDKQRDAIVDDLLKKRPKGPAGVTLTYTEDSEWCERRYEYRTVYHVNQDHYGYKALDLFDMGLRSDGDVSNYIRERFFEGKSGWSLGRKKATVTRRTNRLWNRISSAIYEVLREGAAGIYLIQSGYGRKNFGHVYAESMSEAKQAGQLYYGYLDPGDVRATYVRHGSPADIIELNNKCALELKKDIERQRNQIEECKKSIASLGIRIDTLNLVQIQTLEVEGFGEAAK